MLNWECGKRTRLPFYISHSAFSVQHSAFELGEAALEKAALRLLPRELEGPLVGSARVRGLSEPPAEIGARRMGEAVAAELAALQDRVDEGETGCRSIAHRDGHRAVELHDGRGIDPPQRVVQPDDARPVRRRRGRR